MQYIYNYQVFHQPVFYGLPDNINLNEKNSRLLLVSNNLHQELENDEFRSKNANSCINSKCSTGSESDKDNINQESKCSPPKSSLRVHWTKEEDKKLIDLVSVLGTKKWNNIASLLMTKNGKQCRDHYKNVLDPKIKNSFWTADEERILLSKYEQFGPCWSKIRCFLPGRTPGMIKNYLNALMKSKKNDLSRACQRITEIVADEKCNSNKKDKKNDEFEALDINSLLNRPINYA